MVRARQLRAKAAQVLRDARREAALRGEPLCPFRRELALSYKRHANLIALTPPGFARPLLVGGSAGNATS